MNKYVFAASVIFAIVIIVIISIVVIYALFIKKDMPVDKPPPADKSKPILNLVTYLKAKFSEDYEKLVDKKGFVSTLDAYIKEALTSATKLTPKSELDKELADLMAAETAAEEKLRTEIGREITEKIESGEISPLNEEFE